jgi:hypothetical protein
MKAILEVEMFRNDYFKFLQQIQLFIPTEFLYEQIFVFQDTIGTAYTLNVILPKITFVPPSFTHFQIVEITVCERAKYCPFFASNIHIAMYGFFMVNAGIPGHDIGFEHRFFGG